MTTNNGNETQGLAGLLALNTLGIAGMQYQSLRVRVDLFDETVFLTRYERGLPSQVYEVSPLDLAAAFGDLQIRSPLLPRRCLFWSRQGSTERVGIYLPPVKWGLWLTGRKRKAHVPLPGLMLVGEGRSYRLWAVKHPRNRGVYARDWQPCGTDRLFQAPLPNVNPSGADAGVCQGDAKGEFPQAAAGTMYRAVAALFDTEWSGHWVNGKSEAEPTDVRRMYARARKLGYWPEDDLVGVDLVVGDLLTADGRG